MSINYKKLAEGIYPVISNGGVALLPFDVAYSLNTASEKGIQRIIEIKKRPRNMPCVVLGTPEIFGEITASEFNDRIGKFTFPVGLIEKVNRKSKLFPLLPRRIIKNGGIAVFINMGELGNALAIHAFQQGRLVFGSSANISGAGNHFKLSDVENELRTKADIGIDLGQAKFTEFRKDGRGLSSTMIDLTTRKIVREGLLLNEVKTQAEQIGII